LSCENAQQLASRAVALRERWAGATFTIAGQVITVKLALNCLMLESESARPRAQRPADPVALLRELRKGLQDVN